MSFRNTDHPARLLCLTIVAVIWFLRSASAQNPNSPPVLPQQPDRTVNPLAELVVTNTATDAEAPPEILRYSLVSSPAGATIDSSGIIRWTPTQEQTPSTNLITTFVIDDGVPQMTATNTFTVVVMGSPPVRASRPLSDLLGWWPADGDATDVFGINNALLMNGVGFAPGNLGQAFEFHGENDYVEIPNTSSLNPFGITVEAWIYPSAAPETEAILVNKGGLTDSWRFSLVLTSDTDRNISLEGTIEGRTNALVSSLVLKSTNAIPLGQWTHIAMTLNFQTLLSLYVNGKLNCATNGDSTFLLAFRTNPEPWRLGGGSGQSFDGRIDEFSLYRRALSDDEIQGIYSASAPGTPLPPQIVLNPRNITTGLGTEAVFQVVAASPGGTSLSYQWQFDGTQLPGETNSTLSLLNVQPSNSGPYAVTVSNLAGVVTSSAASLAVAGVIAWGEGDWDGQLDVPANLMNVVAVAAGGAHSLALKADGTVVAWGLNDRYQAQVPPGLSGVVGIAAGGDFSLALKEDGTVVGWGAYQSPARAIPPGLTNAIAISASWYDGLALRTDGTVVAWDGYGNLIALSDSWTNVVAVAGGGLHFLALRADGTILSSGDDSYGQGNVPADLANAVAISANLFHSVALKSDGTVVAWGGLNSNSGLIDVPQDLTNIVAIAAGESVNLALRADGKVVEWGGDTGWGWHKNFSPDLPNVVAISAGETHVVTLLRDGAPQVTVQPWDHSVQFGGSSSFVAKAVGLDAMRYQWRFNGNDVVGATNDTLRIASAKPTDAGSYTLSVSNEVGVVASRQAKLVVAPSIPVATNHPPILPNQVNWAIYEMSPFEIINTATDPDHGINNLNYQLIDPPNGATIDSLGVIRWTPSEAQGPGRFSITTVVTKNGDPLLAATNSFIVSVNEMNSPPVLPAQNDRIVSALSPLMVLNNASDPDIPTNILTYRLINPPAGATIDSSGVIRFIPDRAQGPGTNTIVTVVTDNGIPNLSATNSFRVVVGAPTLAAIHDFTVNPGQLLSFTNTASDNDSARHLSFSLTLAPKDASLVPDSGIFSWRAPLERAGSSNYVLVRVTDDSLVPLNDSRGFSVFVSPLQPAILQPVSLANRAFGLRLNGSIGPDYTLQCSDDLLHWVDLETRAPVSMPFDFGATSLASFTNRFYRVRLSP